MQSSWNKDNTTTQMRDTHLQTLHLKFWMLLINIVPLFVMLIFIFLVQNNLFKSIFFAIKIFVDGYGRLYLLYQEKGLNLHDICHFISPKQEIKGCLWKKHPTSMAVAGLNLHFMLCACGCYDSCSDCSTSDFSSGGHLSLSVLTTQAYPNYHHAKTKKKEHTLHRQPVHDRNGQRESGQRSGWAFTYLEPR